MDRQAIRWAIIGTGGIARRFASDLRYSATGRLVAVGARSPEKAAGLAAVAGDAVSGTIAAVIARPDVDAVYVATPNAAHVELALQVLAAGKPVLVEKPLATTAAGARAIAEAAGDAGLLAMEAMWMRFTPGIVRLKQLVDEGAIGEIRRIDAGLAYAARYAPDDPLFDPVSGGALLDLAVYPASLAVHLAGPADATMGQLRRYPNGAVAAAALATRHGDILAGLSCGLDAEGPNEAAITGTGGVITLHRSMLCPPMLSLRELPPAPVKSPVEAGAPLPRIARPARLGAMRQIASGLKLRRIPTLFASTGLQYQADHFAQCLARGLTDSPVMPLADSTAVLEILEAAAG